jgi:hypothetical protein
MQIQMVKGSEIEEQTAIDTLDQIIRSVATESGMAPDDVENALSWLDESSADRMPRKMEMEEDIAAFARLELRGDPLLERLCRDECARRQMRRRRARA